jgi:DNA polymerase-3 subunit delta
LSENATVEDLRFERKSDGSRTFDPQEIEEFVRLRVAAAGCRAVDERAVVAIAERAGSDLGELGNEIDRVCLALPEGSKLTDSHVEATMRDMGAAWVFSFTNALFERRASDAMRVVYELLAQGDPPIRIVATVASRVAEILAAAEFAHTEGIPTIPSHSGTFVKSVYPTLSAAAKRRFNRPYHAYHAFRQGQQRGVKALRAMHRRLLDLDIALKSGGGEARHLFSAFVTATCVLRA